MCCNQLSGSLTGLTTMRYLSYVPSCDMAVIVPSSRLTPLLVV